MQQEKSCGAIVYRKFHGNTQVLLIRHEGSENWSFPKGHMESGESELETAVREVKEETAIDIFVDPTFRETISYFPRRDTHKTVVYFIGRAVCFECAPRQGEIAEVRWADVNYATQLLAYENDRIVVGKARTSLV